MMKKYLSLFFILLSMACSKKNRITELKMPPVIHLTGENGAPCRAVLVEEN